jgi:hypothetical protein
MLAKQPASQTVRISKDKRAWLTTFLHLAVNYREYDIETNGLVALIGRINSHPDVAMKHYPELFKVYFPDGIPRSFVM